MDLLLLYGRPTNLSQTGGWDIPRGRNQVASAGVRGFLLHQLPYYVRTLGTDDRHLHRPANTFVGDNSFRVNLLDAGDRGIPLLRPAVSAPGGSGAGY